MRNIQDILAEIDRLFDENRASEVEGLLVSSLKEADEAGDNNQKLVILNEMLGYYRQLSDKENMAKTIEETIRTADSMDMQGTVPYATTMLNVANVYRSMGELEKSEQYYKVTEEIYKKALQPSDMLYANFYNNMSLLLQEQQNYRRAEEYLLLALQIVEANNAGFETAVTYANLANTAVMGQNYGKAKEYALKSMNCFEQRGTIDPHYCAAVSALGMCYYNEGDSSKAAECFEKAMLIVENTVGRNSQYYRLKENLDMCGVRAKGIDICRAYYEEYGKTMIEEEFPEYKDKIAVGLAGEGSDCFGYDDESSRDHDWGPSFCMWLSDETYAVIGEKLQAAYEALPKEYKGYKRAEEVQGKSRRGVIRISDFYNRLLGSDVYEDINWQLVEDYALAAATNGQVFTDNEGLFTAMRNKLLMGYPETILYLKIAEDVAKLSQTGQYNYARMLKRGDVITADCMLTECMRHMLRLWHHMNNIYPPHDKWLLKSCSSSPASAELLMLLGGLHDCLKQTDSKKAEEILEKAGEYFAKNLYARDIISDNNTYLDYHTDELLKKSAYAKMSDQELVVAIAKLEFKAFDEVKNEGGRAYCQNDWPTFSVMRKSQYLTWNRQMLLQYIYDFGREFELGHNLITEKYGRMMESTTPEEFEKIKTNFPELSDQKRAVIEQIVAIQMDMAEKLSLIYPNVFGNARKLHTSEDTVWDTSYETYLRGEISTYSDKMLQLYGKFVVNCVNTGINIAEQTMGNTAKLYGFADLKEFNETGKK